MKELRVVFHIDELEKWKLTITNIKNFKSDKPEAKIICLANGEAVKNYIKNSNINNEILGLLERNIVFIACNNALKNFEVEEHELIEGIEIVPAGVVELAIKQMEGYAYIKP